MLSFSRIFLVFKLVLSYNPSVSLSIAYFLNFPIPAQFPGPGVWDTPGELLTPEPDAPPGPPGLLWVPLEPEPGPPDEELPEDAFCPELFCPG